MTLALDPDKKQRIVVESDKEKPRGIQPAFFFKHLTSRQWNEVAEYSDNLESSEGFQQAYESIFAVLNKYIIGWENMFDSEGAEILFDVDKLPDVIGMVELQEVVVALLSDRPDFTTKKISDLPSDLNTDVSKTASDAPE